MTDPTKDILERAAKLDAARQTQIEAQKAVIDRLLKARIMEVSDKTLITELTNERVETNSELFLLRATVSRIKSLLDAEEGATVLSYDLVKEALDG